MLDIFLNQIPKDKPLIIQEELSKGFLGLKEDYLSSESEIRVELKASLLDNDLIFSYRIEGTLSLPCTVCNAPVSFTIRAQENNVVENVEKEHAFDFGPYVRDSFLLEVPPFAECQQGDGGCAHRKEIKNFLKKEKGDVQFPFKEL